MIFNNSNSGCQSCRLPEEWNDFTEEVRSAMEKALKKLDHLDRLENIENKLLAPATGENRIDKAFALNTIRILGVAIIALILCIVFLLTGEHFGLVGALHR